MKIYAQRKAGKGKTGETRFASRHYPSHGPLRFVTSHSRVTRFSLFALASVREAKRLRRIRNYALLRTNSRTQFIPTMYIGLQCLLVKINYSNLCLKVGLVHEKFDV